MRLASLWSLEIFLGLAPGTRLGPYEVLSPLGAGGMGEVYRARDPRLGREVAIKVLPEDATADPERLRRFELEAKAVGALSHPNLLAVFDTGRHDGAPYVVFELLEGETLRARLGRGAFPTPKALDYAIQIARGLAAAHEKRVVHRDPILNQGPPALTEADRGIPPSLERVMRHCLERPDERFQSARDLVFDLESVAAAADVLSADGSGLRSGRREPPLIAVTTDTAREPSP